MRRIHNLKGKNPYVYTGITLRNLGMADLGGNQDRTGHPEVDPTKDKPDPDDEMPLDAEAVPLTLHEVNGWKCSYIDAAKLCHGRPSVTTSCGSAGARVGRSRRR